MAEQGEVIWTECSVPAEKVDAARDFYADLLGWEIVDGPMPGGGGRYVIGKLGERMIAGIYPMDGAEFAGVPPQWLTYFKVDDCDASLEKAVELGGAVIRPAFDVSSVGKIAILADAVGAVFAIIEPA